MRYANHFPSARHYEVCPKSNENDLKKKLLNIHAITVYPLQNRLLVIESAVEEVFT